MADFAKHFTPGMLADFEAAMAAHPVDAQGKPVFVGPEHVQWQQRYRAVRDTMWTATAAFMMELIGSRDLKPVAHTDRRGHRGAAAWNRFLINRDIGDFEFEQLATHLLDAALACRIPASTIDAKHAVAVEIMNAGDFDWFETASRETCRVTGDMLQLEFRNWQPALGTAVVAPGSSWKNTTFVEVTPLEAPKVEHHVLTVPSGRLLIADWFRLPQFTDVVDAGVGRDHESDAAELRTVGHYARSHNFMSIFVGNCDPDVLQRSDHLVIGSTDPDEPEPHDQRGHVSTELWRATAIDRDVLIAMLSRSMSTLDAEQQLRDYMEHQQVLELTVRPGTLHLYHTANHSHMCDFRSPGVAHVKGINLFAVLSERELEWHHKDSPPVVRKPRARP